MGLLRPRFDCAPTNTHSAQRGSAARNAKSEGAYSSLRECFLVRFATDTCTAPNTQRGASVHTDEKDLRVFQAVFLQKQCLSAFTPALACDFELLSNWWQIMQVSVVENSLRNSLLELVIGFTHPAVFQERLVNLPDRQLDLAGLLQRG
jgi:hypothetical protein